MAYIIICMLLLALYLAAAWIDLLDTQIGTIPNEN